MGVRVTDAYGQAATSTYVVTVTRPAPPTVTTPVLTTTGPSGPPQQQQVTISAGDSIVLLNGSGQPVTAVTVAGQGSYALDSTTRVITFTPAAGFQGITTGVTYRISDGYGQSVTGRYVPVVTVTATPTPPPPAPRPRPTPPPVPAKHTVTVASLSVLKGHSGHLPVICRQSKGSLSQCTVTLYAKVSGHTVVVGTGHRTLNGSHRTATVTVTLNHLGRALAARPGGVTVTVSAKERAAGATSWNYPRSRTRVVNALTWAPRPVFFDTASWTLSDPDLQYLKGLRSKLGGVRSVECNGYTDSRSNGSYNQALGLARAKSTCAYLLMGTHIRAVLHSYGDTRPQADNTGPHGQALNRRTEIGLHY